MNVVDSSAWLEYFADGPNAAHFCQPVTQTDQLIVPSVTLYEVFERVLQQRDVNAALQAVAVMRQAKIVDLDQSIALSGAKLSHQLKLPMADSIILATARKHGAMLWTQDGDFKGLDDVHYFSKKGQ